MVKRYYELNAFEENGRCLEPVARWRDPLPPDEDDDRLRVELGYYYRDAFRGGDDCDRFGRCAAASCAVAEASASAASWSPRTSIRGSRYDQLKVVEMNGPRRGTGLAALGG